MKAESISVIIPSFNEIRSIRSLVEVVRTWQRADDIIVVDDCSTDDTEKGLAQFTPGVTYIRHKKNLGQGAALASGIAKARGDILLFLDADVMSLTHKDLDTLISPVATGDADMAIGVLRYWRAGKFEPFTDISGTRVVRMKNVENHIGDIKKSGYGITVLFNELHRRKRVVRVRLPYVYVLGKFDKQTAPDAIKAYVKESKELISEAIKQQAGDLSPAAKQIFKGVLRYLGQALEYFQ